MSNVVIPIINEVGPIAQPIIDNNVPAPPIEHFNKLFINRARASEISVVFTKNCNLKCEFCCVEHGYWRSNDNDFNCFNTRVIEKATNNVLNVIDYLPNNHISITVLGGELFQDKFKQDVFDGLDNFFTLIIDKLKKMHKTWEITLMSNLICKKIDRIVKLANKFDATVVTSYDATTRFANSKVFDLWRRNLGILKNNKIDVAINMVLYKPNFEHIYSKNSVFVDLYNNFKISFSDFEPNNNVDYNNDVYEIGKFLIFCGKNFPKISNVQGLINAYNGDRTIGVSCWHNVIVDDKFVCWERCNRKHTFNVYAHNKRCYTCKYFNFCPLPCPRLYHQYEQCHIKMFFDWYDKISHTELKK